MFLLIVFSLSRTGGLDGQTNLNGYYCDDQNNVNVNMKCSFLSSSSF